MLRALAAVGLLGCGFTARNAAGPGDAIDAAGIDTRDGSGTAAVAKRKPITLVVSVVAGSHPDLPVWVDLMHAEPPARAPTTSRSTTRSAATSRRQSPPGSTPAPSRTAPPSCGSARTPRPTI